INNVGQEAQNAYELQLTINNGVPITETPSLIIPGFSSIEYTFASSLEINHGEVNEIEITVIHPNDQNPDNNSASFTIESFPFEGTVSEDVTVCENVDFLILEASGGSFYQWNTGTFGPLLYLNPVIAGEYTVTITNEEGCTDVQQVNVSTLSVPAQPIIFASSNYLCPNGTLTLSTAPGNIIWSTGEVSASITVSQEGFYELTVVNGEGCASSENIFIDAVEAPQIYGVNGGVICEGDFETIIVSTGFFNSTIEWSTGDTGNLLSVSPDTTTTYFATITTEGCVSAEEFTVTVVPDLTLGSVGNMQPPDGVTGIGLPVNFSWSPAENAAYYEIRVGLEGQSLASIGTTTQINLNYSNLEYGNTYCWQVVPRSCSGLAGEESPIQCFALEPLPDLIVHQVATPTTTAFAGAEIQVEWALRNVGLSNSPAMDRSDFIYLSKNPVFDFSDQLLGSLETQDILSFNEISPVKSQSVLLPECETGTYYLIVRADRWNDIDEAVEDNNLLVSSQTINIQSAPHPDLVISGEPVLDVAGIALAGETYNLNVQISNNGNLATETGFSVYVFLDTTSFYNPLTSTTLAAYQISDYLDLEQVLVLSPLEVTIPPNVTSDDYFLHVFVDFNDQIEECIFNGNNIATTQSFSVLEIPRPDFEVTDLEILSNTASNQENVLLRYRVRNNNAPVVNQNLGDRLFLNDSPNYNTPFSSTPFSEEISLDNGATEWRETNLRIPSNYTGWLYLFVRTNAFGQIPEANVDNNLSPIDSIQVFSPNLRASAVEIPGMVLAGQNITVKWQDENVGDGDLINQTIFDRVYLSTDQNLDVFNDELLGPSSDLATLLAGNTNYVLPKSEWFTIPNGTPAGNYYVIVLTNALYEIHENGLFSDNIAVSPTTIEIVEGQYPNLEAIKIDPSQATAKAGDPLDLTFEIANNGDMVSVGDWVDHIYRCTCPIWDAAVAIHVATVPHSQALAVNGNYTKTQTIDLPFSLGSGNYYFYIQTDATNGIFETDESVESNIRRSVDPVTVEAFNFADIDLAIQNVNPPCDVIPGASATVYFETRNLGSTVTVAGNWLDGIVLSEDNSWDPSEDTLIIAQWPHDDDLSPNQNYSSLRNFTLPNTLSGTYYVLLVTDLYNVNQESTTSNNAAILPQINCNGGSGVDPLVFPQKPDLSIQIINAPNTAIAGQSFTVQYRVTNNSTEVSAIGDWLDKAFLSTSMNPNGAIDLGSKAVMQDSLPAGESYISELEASVPIAAFGNYFLILNTDAGNGLAEEEEGNNLDFDAIFMDQADPSDLIVNQIQAPLLDTIATEMTVIWESKNIGANPAAGQFTQSVYLSKDNAYDGSDVLLGTATHFVDLNPAQSSTYSITGRIENVERGNYFIIVRTDLQNNILESDEGNNDGVRLLPSFIEVPELVIDAPAVFASLPLEKSIYYRVEVAPNQVGETVRISLNSPQSAAFNELYVAFEQMPSRTVYDLGFDQVFSPNQEIIIPEVAMGTYYVMAYAVEGNPLQSIAARAEIVPFEIHSISSDEGGNTGQVTTLITGGKFVPEMEVWLEDETGTTLPATDVIYVSPTTAYVSFDLA
ncbi:MAG: CARDB domain-containing protein, partial [Bacteroidota bacterium]